MKCSFSSFEDPRRSLRTAVPFLLVAAMVGILGGCDVMNHRFNDTDSPATASEVPVDAESVERIDLQYEPVSLSPGDLFSIELSDAKHDRPVTRIVHEGQADGKTALRIRFEPLKPTSVAIQCRNKAANTRRTMRTLTSSEFNLKSGVHPVATSSDDPDSYHYTESDDVIIVEVDYDDEDDSKSTSTTSGPSFHFLSSEQPVQCTHVSFVLNEVTTSLSPTGVRFGGDVEPPAIDSKKIQ